MSRNLYSILTRTIHGYSQTVGPTQVRLYGRWMHRNPAKVILPFEPTANVNLKKEKVINLDPTSFNKSQSNHETDKNNKVDQVKAQKSEPLFSSEKVADIKKKREIKLKKNKLYISQKKVFDDNNNIIYEKLKNNDGRVSTLLVKLKSKKERLRTEQMLVEGWRLIVDGLEAKCTLKYIFFSRVEELNKLRAFLPKTGVLIYKVPYKELELWSDVDTPSGIFGVFEMPSEENIKRHSKPIPLNIICDNIRDPGNLGAILRAAVGAGCDKVFLSKGCVDLWDPKVIRSAAGAHFRQPVISSVEWEEMSQLLSKDTSVFIADSNTSNNDTDSIDACKETEIPVVPYYAVDFAQLKHVTLIIGGETEGISEDSYSLAESRNGIRVNIPLQRGVDSLNTGMAAAVIALEIRKQYIQHWTKLKLEKEAMPAIYRCVDLWDPKVIRSAAGAHFRQPVISSVEWEEMSQLLSKDTSVFIADSNTSNNDTDSIDACKETEIPVVPYYAVDFAQLKHVTLIIGGETEGISEDSYSLAESRNGIRVNIPLQRGVDSLNTGMAAAVIALEIRKQYIQHWTKLKLEKEAMPAIYS